MKKGVLLLSLMIASAIVCAEPFFVRVNGTQDYAAANTGDQDYQGRTQYAALNVSLQAGDRLTCYDQGSGAAWNIAVIDPLLIV